MFHSIFHPDYYGNEVVEWQLSDGHKNAFLISQSASKISCPSCPSYPMFSFLHDSLETLPNNTRQSTEKPEKKNLMKLCRKNINVAGSSCQQSNFKRQRKADRCSQCHLVGIEQVILLILWKGREKTWLYVHCQEALRETPFFIQSQHICYTELQLPYEQLRSESIEGRKTKCCLQH